MFCFSFSFFAAFVEQRTPRSNNPFVRYRRVRCPAELVAISGSTSNDDEDYPAVDLDAYA